MTAGLSRSRRSEKNHAAGTERFLGKFEQVKWHACQQMTGVIDLLFARCGGGFQEGPGGLAFLSGSRFGVL